MTTLSTPTWQHKRLIFWLAAGFLLFFSMTTPFTSAFWNWVDTKCFYLLNQPMRERHFLRIFWALANHNLADWFEDLCILGFYVAAIWKAPKGQRLRRGSQFFCCVIWIALTVLLINRVLCRDLLHLRRQSPTLVLPEVVYLSDFISWMQIKSYSSKSFPGDHATTALMFSWSYAYLVRGKLAIGALIYGVFLCLPRLAAGTHWFSDIAIGSGCIALFSLTWFFFTPIGKKAANFVERLFTPFTKNNS